MELFNKIISLKQAKANFIILEVFSLAILLLFSLAAIDDETVNNFNPDQNGKIAAEAEGQANSEALSGILNSKLPENEDVIKWAKRFVITAYTSEIGQTDDSPCITANNFNVCDNGIEDTIAANFLPFGAKVKIPELFGDRIFTVRDRMNRRFTNRVDVWMIERPDAVKFGVKIARVEVLK